MFFSTSKHQLGPQTVTIPTSKKVSDLDYDLREVESFLAAQQAGRKIPFDTFRSYIVQAKIDKILVGTVIHALPPMGWYLVRVPDLLRDIPCCSVQVGSVSPLGASYHYSYSPGSVVMVATGSGSRYGYLLGGIPVPRLDFSHTNPDWVVQGGGSGFQRSPALTAPYQMEDQSSIRPFAVNVPVDSTTVERGIVASSGACVTVDDFLVQVRINENCGLFLTYVDSYARLSGSQLDIESSVSEFRARDDEGESQIFLGFGVYPWEALGMYQPGLTYTISQAPEKSQSQSMKADLDVDDSLNRVMPFYRSSFYAGYLGQGGLRLVVAPPSGAAAFRDPQSEGPDEGLFREFIGLDGSYLLQSAKSIYIGKRVLIPVPKRVRHAEDGAGDSAKSYPQSGIQSNYKASSMFGSGREHRISQVKIQGEHKSCQAILGADDMNAHLCSWASVHPFYYHSSDFQLPQPSNSSSVFDGITEFLDFSGLADGDWMEEPLARSLRIDHRYQNAEFCQREAFLSIFDDGSIMIACGYGSAIVLSRGSIRIEAPGDVQIMPGRMLTVLSGQTVVRSHGSVDISSSNKDVRIKAEANLHMLSGNGGTGGMLLENKSRGSKQSYKGKIGEEVDGRGIVLKSSEGLVALCGQDVYIRSSSQSSYTGHVVLDAGEQRGSVIVQGSELSVFLRNQARFCTDWSGKYQNFQSVYQFSSQACALSAPSVIVEGVLSVVPKSGLMAAAFHGGISATGNITSGGFMSDKRGGLISKTSDEFVSRMQEHKDKVRTFFENLKSSFSEYFSAAVETRFRGEEKVGNQDTLAMIGFSFRDDDQQKQYMSKNLLVMEPRWQMLCRVGMAGGGSAWNENPVTYQGRQTYPWPGKRKWMDEDILLQYQTHTMFDPVNLREKPRPDPYESAMLGGLKKAKFMEWKTITGA